MRPLIKLALVVAVAVAVVFVVGVIRYDIEHDVPLFTRVISPGN